MNILKTTIRIGLFVVFALSINTVWAQSEKDANVKKELKQVMKELPADVQQEVLSYAKRKRAAIKAIEAKNAANATSAKDAAKEMAATPTKAAPMPEQAKAARTPVPAKAQPQAIQVKPNATAVAKPTATPAPNKPQFMLDAESMEKTSVEWIGAVHDFGKIGEGTVATHTFKFKNTGDKPLKLTRVKASCGCTTPKWSKDEVAPGAEGFIDVSFNTRGKRGMQNKTVTVSGNFEGINKVLRFKGEVMPKPAPKTE